MVTPTHPPANGFVRAARSVYNRVGFSKGYNFVLFFIFAGALMGFTLARVTYFNYNGVFCGGGSEGAAPGECLHYTKGHNRIGMMLHLFCILPAGFLACFQFVPVIRHKLILLHRINGYLVILLALTGIAGALMIARVSFGGGLAIQGVTGFLSIISVGALGMAYYNVKRLQIDQHRAWMLRGWFYMASIVTTRLIMSAMAAIITQIGGYYASWECAKIAYIYGGGQRPTINFYPDCAPYFNGTNPDQHTVVEANMGGRPEQIGAALSEVFGASVWLAVAIHLIGVEIYLQLTPKESERLRQVSYDRQVEAGLKNPGNSGLTVDRFGDAEPWQPKGVAKESYELLSKNGPER